MVAVTGMTKARTAIVVHVGGRRRTHAMMAYKEEVCGLPTAEDIPDDVSRFSCILDNVFFHVRECDQEMERSGVFFLDLVCSASCCMREAQAIYSSSPSHYTGTDRLDAYSYDSSPLFSQLLGQSPPDMVRSKINQAFG